MLTKTSEMLSGMTKLNTYLAVFLQVHPNLKVPEAQVRQLLGESMQVAHGKLQAKHYPSRKPCFKVNPPLH